MSTLIVEYLPGYPISNTRMLLDQFLALLPAQEEVRRHDLLAQPAPIFTAVSQRAYTKRDAIIFNNHTFRVGPAPGQYAGLMTAKKALVLSAAGGVYDRPPLEGMNFMTPLVEAEFRFMGFGETKVVLAEGTLQAPEVKAAGFVRASRQVTEVAGRWYGSVAPAERVVA